MRLFNKYKNYNKTFFLFRNFPILRILKFKKSKWLTVQKFIKKKLKQEKFRNRKKKFKNIVRIKKKLICKNKKKFHKKILQVMKSCFLVVKKKIVSSRINSFVRIK